MSQETMREAYDRAKSTSADFNAAFQNAYVALGSDLESFCEINADITKLASRLAGKDILSLPRSSCVQYQQTASLIYFVAYPDKRLIFERCQEKLMNAASEDEQRRFLDILNNSTSGHRPPMDENSGERLREGELG